MPGVQAGPRDVRVALDVTPAIVGMTGLSRYALMLWAALNDLPDIEIRAFAAGRGRAPQGMLRHRRFPVPLRALQASWRRLGRPRAELLAGDADVVHSLALLAPPTRRPLVVTVHDVMALTRPELYPPSAAARARDNLEAARRATVIVATCRATAQAIADRAGFPSDRIVVAPPGPLGSASPAPPVGVTDPFVLAVGAVTPRKGFAVLAQAAARLGRDCPEVRIAGPDWWGAEGVRRAVREADVHGRVRFLGEVEDGVLSELYRTAAVVCHPSLAEGFGLTCLEAMAAGAAVVAADIPSIREIADGSVALVPAGDPDALAQALSRVLGDERERAALGAAARRRASAFGWDRTASAVAGAYRLALGG